MAAQLSVQPQTAATTSSATAGSPSDASAKLAEAIDDFLGDMEKKFKNISDEILTKLDDMAERCDKLEQEMLMRDTGIDNRSKSTLTSADSIGGRE